MPEIKNRFFWFERRIHDFIIHLGIITSIVAKRIWCSFSAGSFNSTNFVGYRRRWWRWSARFSQSLYRHCQWEHFMHIAMGTIIFRRRADEDFGRFERAFRTVSPSYKGAIRSWLRRMSYRIGIKDGRDVMRVSRDPTVRCLGCGWKYEFNSSSLCPVCSSDRSRLLVNEDPYSKPWNLLFYTCLGFALWAWGIIYFWK